MDPPKVCKNGGPKWPFICALSYFCVTSPSAEIFRLGVEIKVQVKPNFFYKNTCMDPPKVCKNGGPKWPFICVLSYLCVICHPVCLAQWLEHQIGSVMGVGSILTCDNNFFSYVVFMLSLCRL